MKYVAILLLFISINAIQAEGSGLPLSLGSSKDIAQLSLSSLLQHAVREHKDTFIVATAAVMLAKLVMFKKAGEQEGRADLFSSTGLAIGLAMLFDEWKKQE